MWYVGYAKVKLGEWVEIGESGNVNAVVCTVYTDNAIADIEVVYLDNRDRTINEDVVWKDGFWDFKYTGPIWWLCG